MFKIKMIKRQPGGLPNWIPRLAINDENHEIKYTSMPGEFYRAYVTYPKRGITDVFEWTSVYWKFLKKNIHGESTS